MFSIMNYIKRKYSENKLVGVFISIISLLFLFGAVFNSSFEIVSTSPDGPPASSQIGNSMNLLGSNKAIYLNSCRTLRVPNSVYILKRDVSSSGNCFIINADNITLNGNGHKISGSGDLESKGVFSEGYMGLKVKDIKIENYGFGIYLTSGSNESMINGVEFYDISNISIFVFDSNNIEIEDSQFNGNLGSEVVFLVAKNYSINAHINDNTFKNNMGGAIRGKGITAMIENNKIFDEGIPTDENKHRGIWIQSIKEGLAPGKVIVPSDTDIRNNLLVRIGGSGITCSAYDGNYCDIHNNTLKDIYGPSGIRFGPIGAIARDNFIFNSQNIGIEVLSRNLTDIYIINNTIVNSHMGISLIPGLFTQPISNVRVQDNLIINPFYGLFITGKQSSSNTGSIFINNTILNSRGDAIYLDGKKVSNMTFVGNDISGTNIEYSDLNVASENINYLNFLNNLIGKYSFFGFGSSDVVIEDDEFGNVKFLSNITGGGERFSDEVIVMYNFAEVDGDENSGFGVPARVTLFNMPGNFENPVIFRNGEFCDECVALTGLNEEIVIFEVPGAGSYLIGDA